MWLHPLHLRTVNDKEDRFTLREGERGRGEREGEGERGREGE